METDSTTPSGADSDEPRPRRSIVAKLSLFVGLLVALTAASLIAVGHLYVGELVGEQIDARLSVIADDHQARVLMALREAEGLVRMAASRSRPRNLLDQRRRGEIDDARFRAEIQTVVDDILAGSDRFLAVRLEDENGETSAESGSREALEEFPAGRVITPALVGSTPAAILAADVRDRDGALIGRLLAVVNLDQIAREATRAEVLGRTGELLIGAREGDEVRLLFPPRRASGVLHIPIEKMATMALAFQGRSGLARTTDHLGHEVLEAYRPVGVDHWGVVVKIDEAEARAPVVRLQWRMAAVGGAILAVGLVASYLLARRHARPLRQLAKAAENAAAGNLNAPIQIASNDEVGALSRAFTRMTGELARSRSDLERRIIERTRDLEAARDLLDAFFQITTSQPDSQNIERTIDSVLAFCARLGYDPAMIALVDREAGLIRGARAIGTLRAVVGETVRPLDGPDVLASVVREGRVLVIADSTVDPRCDREAVARAGIRGQIILPLIGEKKVLGTLQVASPAILDPARVDLRPLETLANHTGRALDRLGRAEEIRRLNESLERHADELAKSEAALREQTEILRSVLDCMSEGVVAADVDLRLLVFNPAAERLMGRRAAEVASETWSPGVPVYSPNGDGPLQVNLLPLHRAIRGETVGQEEIMIGHASPQRGICLLVNGRPLVDERGTVRGGLVVLHDITQRKRIEWRLAVESETARALAEAGSLADAAPGLLQVLVDRLGWDFGAFWRVDTASGRVQCLALQPKVEGAAAELDERIRTLGLQPGECLAGRAWADRAPVWVEDLSREPECPLNQLLIDRGERVGLAIPFPPWGECLGVLALFSREFREIDDDLIDMLMKLGDRIGQFIDRSQMRARVVQSEKLASLGMLSASVAHEINNPLAYVGGNLASLERDVRSLLDIIACYERGFDAIAASQPDLAAEIRELDDECDLNYLKEHLCNMLGSTRKGVKRVADIVHNLRGFTRFDRGAADRIDLRQAVGEALEMVRGRFERSRIVVEQEWATIPLVPGSLSQLSQVFLNLLVNAKQAIEATHREDGRIVISAYQRCNNVCVEVRDNGCGMSPESLSQVFDPFFTTKSPEEGTGLGLPISHGIVIDHGGRVEVESELGVGTCFRVVLPTDRETATP